MSTMYKGNEFLLNFAGNGFVKVVLVDELSNELAVEIISKGDNIGDLMGLFDSMLECVK